MIQFLGPIEDYFDVTPVARVHSFVLKAFLLLGIHVGDFFGCLILYYRVSNVCSCNTLVLN